MKTAALVVLLTLLTGALSAEVTQIIAHRGASVERPECTLSSIKRAIKVDATAVEVDVRTSRDGQLFILHDATLDRTTDGSGVASEVTLSFSNQFRFSGDRNRRDFQFSKFIDRRREVFL